MTNELVKATESVDLDALQRTAKMLAVSGYFEVKQDMTVAIAQMATKILAGRELGYGPFASASGIHVIKGKPSLGANLMASAVKNHPKYDYRVRQLDDSGCVVEFFENGESLGKSEFTTKDAQTAGLTGNDNWKKYARNMFFARAMSNGVRWYCPDVFAGNAVYVPEELGAETDEEGNVVDVDWHTVEPVDPDPKPQTQPPQATNGNGNDEPAVPADNPFDDAEPVKPDMSEKTRKTLHALGSEVYGDDWDAKRHELVQAVSKGAITSSNDLTEKEAETLIAGMRKLKAQKAAKAAQEQSA